MAVRLVETRDSPDASGRIGGVWGDPQKNTAGACPVEDADSIGELAEGAGGREEEPRIFHPLGLDAVGVSTVPPLLQHNLGSV